MNDDWIPLGGDRATMATLHEGLPPWMETRFWAWLDGTVNALAGAEQMHRTHFVAQFDERAQLIQPLSAEVMRYDTSLELKTRQNATLTLAFADFLLAKADGRPEVGDLLETVLSSAKSAWRVGMRDKANGLERRVPVGVQEAADAVMNRAGTAGKLLSDAWHAVFGLRPDPDVAYKKAILAVEAAGGQKVTPKDKVGTLGKMTTAMRDQGWKLPLADEPTHPSSDVLWKMAKAMVAGEQGRHAANGTYTPATQEEAESAVFLAVSLVQFFHADLAKRR